MLFSIAWLSNLTTVLRIIWARCLYGMQPPAALIEALISVHQSKLSYAHPWYVKYIEPSKSRTNALVNLNIHLLERAQDLGRMHACDCRPLLAHAKAIASTTHWTEEAFRIEGEMKKEKQLKQKPIVSWTSPCFVIGWPFGVQPRRQRADCCQRCLEKQVFKTRLQQWLKFGFFYHQHPQLMAWLWQIYLLLPHLEDRGSGGWRQWRDCGWGGRASVPAGYGLLPWQKGWARLL